jgi:hypothetical protein
MTLLDSFPIGDCVNGCASNPCQNGGTCRRDLPNLFRCSCLPGYSGTLCQTNINECASNPCQNGGTCVDAINSFSCQCAAPFVGFYCSLQFCNSTATLGQARYNLRSASLGTKAFFAGMVIPSDSCCSLMSCAYLF